MTTDQNPNSLPLKLTVDAKILTHTANFHMIGVKHPNTDVVGFYIPFTGTREQAEEYTQSLLVDIMQYVKNVLGLIVPVEVKEEVQTDD